jgi:PKD repeat protein
VIQQYTIAPIVCADIPKDMLTSLRMSQLVKAIEPVAFGDVGIHEVMQIGASSTPTQIASARIPWGVIKIRATELQSKGITGKTIKVGIVDTGGDYKHPDLAATYAGGWDFVNNDADPFDDNGHGTHVWGTIAASMTGTILGVAPDVKVYLYKVLNNAGLGTFDTIIAAYQRAIVDGCHVTNNSYGGAGGSVALEAAVTALTNAGVVMVCSAGNAGAGLDTVGYPAHYAGAIAVGATDSADLIATFSSRGPKVEISAPGVDIESTLPGGLYGLKSGTSMACPHVVGSIALALGAGVSASDIHTRMQLAVDLGPPGRDNDFGFGLMDAVNFATNETPPALPPQVKPIVTFDGTRSIDLDGTLVDYSWDFGDGTTGKGASTIHKYATFGLKNVVLTVTDNLGAKASKLRPIQVLANQRPIAKFKMTPDSRAAGVTITFDASGSSDGDGTIVSNTWEFSDGPVLTGPIVSRNFPNVGDISVLLSVVDDYGGVLGKTQLQFWVSIVPNKPPTAVASVQPITGTAPLTILCDAAGSADSDGTISLYSWNVGGVGSALGLKSQFTLPSAGTFEVVLTVTDNNGLTASKSTSVVVGAANPSNLLPTADFTANGV